MHPCAHIEAAVLAWRHVLNGTLWGPAACEQLRDKSGVASAVAQLCSIIRLALQPCSTAQNVSCSNNILAALQQELSCHAAQMYCSGTAMSKGVGGGLHLQAVSPGTACAFLQDCTNRQ